ncbi:MAG: hypothetical protein FVQ85_01055 [Planctomycetes bacterium]|nr:hypothetical protein [Planctomycetota bacterium]
MKQNNEGQSRTILARIGDQNGISQVIPLTLIEKGDYAYLYHNDILIAEGIKKDVLRHTNRENICR